MPPSSVSVRVPATSANLGSGFDCLGMALDVWGAITLSKDTPEDEHPLARMALNAARALFAAAELEPPAGYAATYDGPIPIARGLGASAVARVGGLLAANALAGDPFDREHLLFLAAELEGHADNAAPALFGGLQVVVRERQTLLRLGVPLPPGLKAVLLVPELLMPTQKSRKLLPHSLSRADAVQNGSRAALPLAGGGEAVPGDVRHLRRGEGGRRPLRLPLRRRVHHLRPLHGERAGDRRRDAGGGAQPRGGGGDADHRPHRAGRGSRGGGLGPL